jgi:hypothetical protein
MIFSSHRPQNLKTSLNANDRAVFDRWVWRVTAFYSLLVASLVAAMLLGSHTSVDERPLVTTSTMEHGSSANPTPVPGGSGE